MDLLHWLVSGQNEKNAFRVIFTFDMPAAEAYITARPDGNVTGSTPSAC